MVDRDSAHPSMWCCSYYCHVLPCHHHHGRYQQRCMCPCAGQLPAPIHRCPRSAAELLERRRRDESAFTSIYRVTQMQSFGSRALWQTQRMSLAVVW